MYNIVLGVKDVLLIYEHKAFIYVNTKIFDQFCDWWIKYDQVTEENNQVGNVKHDIGWDCSHKFNNSKM